MVNKVNGNSKKTLLPSNMEKLEAAEQEKEEASLSKDEKREFVKALADDKDARRAYAEEVIEKVDLNIWADTIAFDFFRAGTLSIGDPLWYELEYEVDSQMPVYQLSQHGGTPAETYVTDGDTVRIHPYYIQTPEVSANKFNLRQGNLSTEEKIRRRSERNMEKMLNKDAWALLEEGLTNDLEGDIGVELDPDYNNFPSENDIDMSAEGGLTLDVFKKIADHFNRVDKTVNNIYVPSNKVADIYDWVSVVSGHDTGDVQPNDVVPQGIHEEVVRNGQFGQLFGYNFNIVPTNALDGEADDVYIWVSTTEPAGEYRDIRELDDVYFEEDASRLYVTMTKGVAMMQAPFQKMNYARIQIDSA